MMRTLRKEKSLDHLKKVKVGPLPLETTTSCDEGGILTKLFLYEDCSRKYRGIFNIDKEEVKLKSLSWGLLHILKSLFNPLPKKNIHVIQKSNLQQWSFSGKILNNLSFYMVVHVLERRINRILIDKESEINILPNHTINELGITNKELIKIRIMI